MTRHRFPSKWWHFNAKPYAPEHSPNTDAAMARFWGLVAGVLAFEIVAALWIMGLLPYGRV